MDSKMSDSNVVTRRDQNIKNHLFIVDGVIHSNLKSKNKCIDIQIYDLVRAFDNLWVEETFNDLYDNIDEPSKDEKLALLYKTSEDNAVAVNTR